MHLQTIQIWLSPIAAVPNHFLLAYPQSKMYPQNELPCVSKIVAFIVKNIDTIIFFACWVSWLDLW